MNKLTNHIKFVTVLLVTASSASLAGCGGDDPADKGVGVTCSNDSQCGTGLYCEINGDVIDGQCTATCSSSDMCKQQFGDYSFCIGAYLCVRECSRDDECPAHTSCGSNGWCVR
jgi:hypothetical protein